MAKKEDKEILVHTLTVELDKCTTSRVVDLKDVFIKHPGPEGIKILFTREGEEVASVEVPDNQGIKMDAELKASLEALDVYLKRD